jgi:hypothetical protein
LDEVATAGCLQAGRRGSMRCPVRVIPERP